MIWRRRVGVLKATLCWVLCKISLCYNEIEVCDRNEDAVDVNSGDVRLEVGVGSGEAGSLDVMACMCWACGAHPGPSRRRDREVPP